MCIIDSWKVCVRSFHDLKKLNFSYFEAKNFKKQKLKVWQILWNKCQDELIKHLTYCGPGNHPSKSELKRWRVKGVSHVLRRVSQKRAQIFSVSQFLLCMLSPIITEFQLFDFDLLFRKIFLNFPQHFVVVGRIGIWRNSLYSWELWHWDITSSCGRGIHEKIK